MPERRHRKTVAIHVAENQPPADRPERECQRGEHDGEEQQQRVGAARVRYDVAWLDLAQHPPEQRYGDREPDKPGPPPATASDRGGTTRVRWRGQRGRRLRR